MKLLLPVLLIALTVVCNSAGLPSPRRSSFSVGSIQSGDRLLERTYWFQAPPVPNAIRYRDYVFRGNASTIISAVSSSEVGNTQYGATWIRSGGVGYNNVTVRVQNSWGFGYHYVIDVWGR